MIFRVVSTPTSEEIRISSNSSSTSSSTFDLPISARESRPKKRLLGFGQTLIQVLLILPAEDTEYTHGADVFT
jgi:hypothetical protein